MPIDEVLVSALPGDRRAAARDRGVLVRLAVDGGASGPRLGELHLGRVLRLAPSMDAAFVDLGGEHPGILMRSDAPAGRPLSEGARILVRVTREAEGRKGPKLDARLQPDERALAQAAECTHPSPPWRIAAGADPIAVLIRLAAGPSLQRVVVDDAQTLAALRVAVPEVASRLQLWQEPHALFASRGLDDDIATALASEVPLPSGGRVTFEHTAAVTAIDVDLGAAAGFGASAKAAALACDLEAAEVIGRQIVLRDLAGLIVIDFVPVRRPGERGRVQSALQAALSEDDRAVRIAGWTRLGLLELTRQRHGPSLSHRLSAGCTACAGDGRSPAAWWTAGEALRAVLAASRQTPGAVPRLAASPSILAALAGPLAAARAAVEAKLGCRLELTEGTGAPGVDFLLQPSAPRRPDA